MIIVVEIVGRTGDRACKEYDVPSINTAVEAARRELRACPKFLITDIWIKGNRPVPREPAEEW
jgi:hypothetical protein